MLKYIEAYVQKVNPSKAPEIVGALLDVECDEAFITNLITSIRSLIPVEQLVEEVVEIPRLQNVDKVADVPVASTGQTPQVRSVSFPQVQPVDKFVDFP